MTNYRNQKHYVFLQIREIQEHKYYLNQNYDYELDMNFVFEDWVKCGQAKSFCDKYESNKNRIESFLSEQETKQGGLEVISMSTVHHLLGDQIQQYN